MMGPFTLTLAVLPLAGYLLVLAGMRLAGWVVVISGGRDLAAVMLAIAGLVAIGPVELFFPKASAMLIGPYVWLPVAVLYGLIVTLIGITARPRIVVYGRTPEQVFAALANVAARIDGRSSAQADRWLVTLPETGLHLRLEGTPGYDCVNILCFQPRLAPELFRQLMEELKRELLQQPRTRGRHGWVLMATAVLLLALIATQAVQGPAELVQDFRRWLIR